MLSPWSQALFAPLCKLSNTQYYYIDTLNVGPSPYLSLMWGVPPIGPLLRGYGITWHLSLKYQSEYLVKEGPIWMYCPPHSLSDFALISFWDLKLIWKSAHLVQAFANSKLWFTHTRCKLHSCIIIIVVYTNTRCLAQYVMHCHITENFQKVQFLQIAKLCIYHIAGNFQGVQFLCDYWTTKIRPAKISTFVQACNGTIHENWTVKC